MRYINPKSRRGVVNMLADHIVKSINPEFKTRIEVVDFKAFFVIWGVTNSNELIDVNKLVEEFVNDNESVLDYLKITNINVIDLIEYNDPLEPTDYHYKFYKTTRPAYHQRIINEVFSQPFPPKYDKEMLNSISHTTETGVILEFPKPFIFSKLDSPSYTNFHSISSEFPHGYSLNLGRIEFYYSEYICNHLMDYLSSDSIYFTYTNRLNNNDDVDIDFDVKSIYSKKDLISMTLDVFDFDLQKFSENYLKNYDIYEDLTKPFDTKPWLVKDKLRDLIII